VSPKELTRHAARYLTIDPKTETPLYGFLFVVIVVLYPVAYPFLILGAGLQAIGRWAAKP
jgi:hypothetical protein